MKVLIICNDFPPLNSIGAERPFSWFAYFKKFGHDVTVITKDWGKLDAESTSLMEYLEATEGELIRVPNQTFLPQRIFEKHGADGRDKIEDEDKEKVEKKLEESQAWLDGASPNTTAEE